MNAPDLTGMPGQCEDGPLGVGLDVPDANGLVVGTADDPRPPVKLDTTDAFGMAFKGPHVTLAAQ